MKTFLATFFLLLVFNSLSAQPHISGNVSLDMDTGLISCSFTLSKIPNIENYRILLNKGMNIKYFKDDQGNLLNYDGHYQGKMHGEGLAYYFSNSKNDSLPLPSSFYIAYKGAFPIYENDWNAFDYKGMIAFNGKTVRATEQTKWYPIIYDVSKDIQIQDYTYDLNISIKGGASIFINGSAPQKAKTAHFTSSKAFPLLLFAGNYDFINNEGDYILNTEIDSETAKKIFKNIEIIKDKLAASAGFSFTDNIYLISHEPINQRKKGSSWGFNTYPSFAFTGLDFKDLIDEADKFNHDTYKYFGHEFAHNYFGNNVLSGKLKWFWLESFPEFMSYRIAEDLCGRDYLTKTLLNQTKQLEGKKFIPLNQVQKDTDIDNTYRYILGPLLLRIFEDRFGRDKTDAFIANLLNTSKMETLTLDHWQKAAIEIGIPEKEFETFKSELIIHENFDKHVTNEIVKNYSLKI